MMFARISIHALLGAALLDYCCFIVASVSPWLANLVVAVFLRIDGEDSRSNSCGQQPLPGRAISTAEFAQIM